MLARSGTAVLPLHSGYVPAWLSARMAVLGRVITEVVILHYGRDEFLRRLAHPGWFQCFGAVMGMDWHSSGITTSVLGALKRGLAPVQSELGLYVCGGRGQRSRQTPAELEAISGRIGLDGADLVRTSRLVAKVDSAAIQDGYDIYLHGFVLADDGKWTIVQQGMNTTRREARRYHWLSEGLTSFVDAPHAAIDGPRAERPIVNLTDHRATPAREAQVTLLQENPDRVLRTLSEVTESRRPVSPVLELPFHHDVRPENIIPQRLRASLIAAHERGPKDFADVLLTPGVGPRTVFSLSLVAEVLHGTPSRFSDPARYSLAHGGKDGHPYPVPLKVYDETIRVLKDAVAKAKLGSDERLSALNRLDHQARQVERTQTGDEMTTVDVAKFIGGERERSAMWGGRTVNDP